MVLLSRPLVAKQLLSHPRLALRGGRPIVSWHHRNASRKCLTIIASRPIFNLSVILPIGLKDAGSAKLHFRGTRRPHPPRHPSPAGARRDLGDRTRQALRDVHARGLEASEGAGARRPDRSRPRGAVASLSPGSRPAQGGCKLDRRVSPILGGEVRPARRLPARDSSGQDEIENQRFRKEAIEDQTQGVTSWPNQPMQQKKQTNSSSPEPSTRPAKTCGMHSPSPST